MVEIGEAGLDVANIPEQPIHDIDKMGELSKQRPAIQTGVAMPTSWLIITLVAVPIAIKLNHINLSQLAGIHHLLDPDRRRGITILHHAKDLFPITQRGIDHPLGVRQSQGHRFLDHHMMSRLDRLDRHLSMQTIRHANIDHIHVRSNLQQLFQIFGKRNWISLNTQLLLRADIAQSHQLRLLVAGDHLRMTLTNVATTDHGKSYFLVSIHNA